MTEQVREGGGVSYRAHNPAQADATSAPATSPFTLGQTLRALASCALLGIDRSLADAVDGISLDTPITQVATAVSADGGRYAIRVTVERIPWEDNA